MILKDEEIEGLFASGNIEAKIIAKAQLKKVMEEYTCEECSTPNFKHIIIPLREYNEIMG